MQIYPMRLVQRRAGIVGNEMHIFKTDDVRAVWGSPVETDTVSLFYLDSKCLSFVKATILSRSVDSDFFQPKLLGKPCE